MLTTINELVTFLLAAFVFGSAICRIDAIDMKTVQYRYVAPIVLALVWSASVLLQLVGGDIPDWYAPLGLLGFGLFLFNNRLDWAHGVPAHMLRETFLLAETLKPGNVRKRLRAQNLATATLVLVSVGASGLGASDGRGQPVQIYSAHADPIVTVPGGEIDIVYSMRRVRTCSGYADRFIVNPRTNTTVQNFERQPVGSLKPGGRVDARVHLKLADLPAGNYVYRAVVYSNCPDEVYVQQTPDVPITVAPAASDPDRIEAAPLRAAPTPLGEKQ